MFEVGRGHINGYPTPSWTTVQECNELWEEWLQAAGRLVWLGTSTDGCVLEKLKGNHRLLSLIWELVMQSKYEMLDGLRDAKSKKEADVSVDHVGPVADGKRSPVSPSRHEEGSNGCCQIM